MKSQRASAPRDGGASDPEGWIEVVPRERVELVELRYAVTAPHGTGLGGLLYVFALLGVLATIAVLAIATSSGWSVLRAWG
jgi:hypothetical protein